MSDKREATFHGAGPSFTDTLRAAATEPVTDLPGLLTAAALHIDRLVQRLAQATGVPEGTVAISEGLNEATTARSGPGAFSRPRAVSGAVVADSARIAPRPEPERHGWYGDHGWQDRDDAHRVTFEGEGA